MVHGEGPGIQQALIDTGSHAGVAGQESSQRQRCLGPCSLTVSGKPTCLHGHRAWFLDRGARAWAWQGFPSAGLTSHRSSAEHSEVHGREKSERDAAMDTEALVSRHPLPPQLSPADKSE